MKKFIVEESFWELFPDARIGIVLCTGIDNKQRDETVFADLLAEGENRAKTYLTEPEFSSNRVIKIWREAFQKFKTFKGARSSIESLLKRTQSGKKISNINPLVDIYNSISLRYALPCGGEDLDSIIGDIRLTKADGNEAFITLGSDENNPPYESEIVYKDDAGAICRCLNWRESARTMLTEKTKDAFMCIENMDLTRNTEFEEALDALKNEVTDYLGGNCSTFILDYSTREIEICGDAKSV